MGLNELLCGHGKEGTADMIMDHGMMWIRLE
jgi:hypothetical protein